MFVRQSFNVIVSNYVIIQLYDEIYLRYLYVIFISLFPIFVIFYYFPRYGIS